MKSNEPQFPEAMICALLAEDVEPAAIERAVVRVREQQVGTSMSGGNLLWRAFAFEQADDLAPDLAPPVFTPGPPPLRHVVYPYGPHGPARASDDGCIEKVEVVSRRLRNRYATGGHLPKGARVTVAGSEPDPTSGDHLLWASSAKITELKGLARFLGLLAVCRYGGGTPVEMRLSAGGVDGSAEASSRFAPRLDKVIMRARSLGLTAQIMESTQWVARLHLEGRP